MGDSSIWLVNYRRRNNSKMKFKQVYINDKSFSETWKSYFVWVRWQVYFGLRNRVKYKCCRSIQFHVLIHRTYKCINFRSINFQANPKLQKLYDDWHNLAIFSVVIFEQTKFYYVLNSLIYKERVNVKSHAQYYFIDRVFRRCLQ